MRVPKIMKPDTGKCDACARDHQGLTLQINVLPPQPKKLASSDSSRGLIRYAFGLDFNPA